MDKNWKDRTTLVIGEENTKKLENTHIVVLGVGGVGGFVVEMFARLGVGKITVVDFDKFDKTNLNRQILSTREVIGNKKVDEARKRILSINSDCEVITFDEKITSENLPNLLSKKCDYVVDAIDDVRAKIEVIKYCSNNDINLICSMGTGNKCGIPNFVIEDLWKTSYDGLARKMRNELKKEGFKSKVNVCYTKEKADACSGELGSVVYYPLMCAGTLVSFVTNKIIK